MTEKKSEIQKSLANPSLAINESLAGMPNPFQVIAQLEATPQAPQQTDTRSSAPSPTQNPLQIINDLIDGRKD